MDLRLIQLSISERFAATEMDLPRLTDMTTHRFVVILIEVMVIDLDLSHSHAASYQTKSTPSSKHIQQLYSNLVTPQLGQGKGGPHNGHEIFHDNAITGEILGALDRER